MRVDSDPEVRFGLWKNSTHFEAFGRVSHIFLMKVDSDPKADSPGLPRTWKFRHHLRVQRMMGWVRFFQHFLAFLTLRPHGCECPFFQPSVTKSSSSSRARGGGDAGSTPIQFIHWRFMDKHDRHIATSAPPPPPHVSALGCPVLW